MKILLLTFTIIIIAVTPGTAGVIFTLGNSPQPGEQNVLYNMGQTGATVTGTTNMTDTLVSFMSVTDTLMESASGQAKLTSQDQRINDVSISLTSGGTFDTLIFNPFSGGTAAGPATVTVFTNNGSSSFTYPGGLKKGQNFLSIMASTGTVIDRVTITAIDGFKDLDQVRISGISPASVPEPGTLGLMAIAVLALAGIVRRRS